MHITVKQVTTEFNQNEDRISFTCVLNDNSTVVIWLSSITPQCGERTEVGCAIALQYKEGDRKSGA